MISTLRPKPLITFARLRRTLAKTPSNDEQILLKQNNRRDVGQTCVTEAVKPSMALSKKKWTQHNIDSGGVPEVEDEVEEENFGKKAPHYTKIAGWDRNNQELKVLGKLLSSKRARENSDVQVLEGVRLIRDCIELGIEPTVIVFSRVKLLLELSLPPKSATRLYHLPYTNIKLWTDLTTSPGIMAAIPKSSLEHITATSPLPITLVCDNIRGPDNLGAIIRVAAAVGVKKIICTGCTDAWSSKSVRAGAGAHFHTPIVQGVNWVEVQGLLTDPWSQLVVADLPREGDVEDNIEDSLPLGELEKRVEMIEERLTMGEEEEELVVGEFKQLPPPSMDYTKFNLQAGFKEVVVVIGGETEGVSGAAYRLCHRMGGSRLHIPLRNSVNSLNVISAASVILFRIQQAMLECDQAGGDIKNP